jgi:excisionase family DNA binding protein
MIDESFLTTEEVLEYLQVNLRTVYRLIKAGKIPAVRVGRQWRFRKRDIDAWLESQRPRNARATPATARPAATASGARVLLVVDDEHDPRPAVEDALAEHDVDIAPDGRTVLERLRIIPYDLITDLKMPSTAHGHPRGAPSHADLLVIITGFPNEASAIEAVNLGVSGYSRSRSGAARPRAPPSPRRAVIPGRGICICATARALRMPITKSPNR